MIDKKPLGWSHDENRIAFWIHEVFGDAAMLEFKTDTAAGYFKLLDSFIQEIF